jgi:hypothetical protein
MKFNELERIASEVLTCEYIVGTTENGQYVYIWVENEEIDGEIPQNLLDNPEGFKGAMVGTKEQIIDEIENCVGSFRYHGDELLQEAATEVVETLLEALEV